MGIVGVNSTIGRAVKCVDPDKTTRSESGWLGYTLCALINHAFTSVVSRVASTNIFMLCRIIK